MSQRTESAALSPAAIRRLTLSAAAILMLTMGARLTTLFLSPINAALINFPIRKARPLPASAVTATPAP